MFFVSRREFSAGSEVPAAQFDMKWIELRSICYKNICALDASRSPNRSAP
jgi:hypothetical protein